MKRGIVIAIILITFLIPFTSANLLDWFKKDIQMAPNANTDVRVGVGNVAPQIVSIQTISNINLIPSSTTNVIFNFTARDSNGANDLDDSSATANFSSPGEPTRFSTSCIQVLQSGKQRTYQCTIPMQYYDRAGLWNIAIEIKDQAGLTAQDSSTSFTLNLLRDISLSSTSITFPTLVQGDVNTRSSQDTTITNNGNAVVPSNTIQLTAHNLIGETTPAENIPASSFTSASTSLPNICTSGNSLIDNSAVTISSVTLPRGPIGSNTGIIGYCLTLVPEGISSQYYSASLAGGTAWTISLN